MKKLLIFIVSLLLYTSYTVGFAKTKDINQIFLISGDVRAEIKPCGCSKGADIGGIERLSTLVKRERASHKKFLWIDLGNFNTDLVNKQAELRNQLWVDFFATVPELKAALPGVYELNRGFSYLSTIRLKKKKTTKLFPFVLTNQPRKTKIKTVRVYKKFAFYGFLSPSFFSTAKLKYPYLSSVDKFLANMKKTKTTRTKILLFRGSKKELIKILDSHIFSLVMPANPAENELYQKLDFKLTSGKTKRQYSLITPPVRGQGLLSAVYSYKKQAFVSHKITWLTSKYPSDTAWATPFKQYNQQVKAMFLASLQKVDKKQAIKYKGVTYCSSCHVDEAKKWHTTEHSHAWNDLKKVNKNFDPECITCHVVKYKKGGFISEERTPNLVNVQCEACHGEKTAKHITSKEKTQVTVKTCQQCHTIGHSPSFNFSVYFPKIQHHKTKNLGKLIDTKKDKSG